MKFLFTSDWHVRCDQPVNRKDDFLELQKKALIELADLAKMNEAIIIIAGDIFHRSLPLNSQYLESLLYDIFYGIDIYFIPGQHDLLNHNIDNFDQGSIGILNRFSNWKYHQEINFGDQVIFWNFGWNQKIEEMECYDDFLKIAVLHKFVSDQPLPFWAKDKGIIAKDLCNNYKEYNIFLCGDNHSSFIYENSRQIVFNPGCLTRQKISEKEYKPRCYIYDTNTRKYEIIYLLDNNPLVFREDTKEKEKLERESRINSFIELVSKNREITWNYEENLKQYCLKNRIEENIINEINNTLQECYKEKK